MLAAVVAVAGVVVVVGGSEHCICSCTRHAVRSTDRKIPEGGTYLQSIMMINPSTARAIPWLSPAHQIVRQLLCLLFAAEEEDEEVEEEDEAHRIR